MDIQRKGAGRKKAIRIVVTVVVLVVAGVGITVGLSKLKPAAPGVEMSTLWPDTVKRGPMLRDVRGLGTLVPEDTLLITATTDGRVQRILIRPGAHGEGRFGGDGSYQPGAGNPAADRGVRPQGCRSRLRKPEGDPREDAARHAGHGRPGGRGLQHGQAAGRPRYRAGQGKPAAHGRCQDFRSEGPATGRAFSDRAEAAGHQRGRRKSPARRRRRSKSISCAPITSSSRTRWTS